MAMAWTIQEAYDVDSNRNIISYENIDSAITIQGDTMQCIRILIKMISSKDSVILDKFKMEHAAIDYLNTLSDYIRSSAYSSKWLSYWKQLRNNGYRYIGKPKWRRLP